MNNFIIYLGGDNQTGKIDRPKIRRFLMKRVRGFTINATANGWWYDSQENKWYNESSVKIEITLSSKTIIQRILTEMKKEFNQREIGLRVESPIQFR